MLNKSFTWSLHRYHSLWSQISRTPQRATDFFTILSPLVTEILPLQPRFPAPVLPILLLPSPQLFNLEFYIPLCKILILFLEKEYKNEINIDAFLAGEGWMRRDIKIAWIVRSGKRSICKNNDLHWRDLNI